MLKFAMGPTDLVYWGPFVKLRFRRYLWTTNNSNEKHVLKAIFSLVQNGVIGMLSFAVVPAVVKLARPM